MATARKRVRCDLTVLQKKEMCEFKTKHAKSTQEQIAERFSSKWNFYSERRKVGDVLKQSSASFIDPVGVMNLFNVFSTDAVCAY